MKASLAGVIVVALGLATPLAVRAQNRLVAESAVAEQIGRIEEQFRVAKLGNDITALERILDREFFETNQNGNSRDKRQMIELFRTFPIQSLRIDRSSVRVTKNVAVVSGAQTEVNMSGTDRMLFTRVYVENNSRWRLVSSSQFRDPRR